MRHKVDGRKLGRTSSHRKAMLANMASNLFLHKQIRTAHAKALEARRLAESLITKAKRGDVHSRRLVMAILGQKDVVKILFDEIAPQYADRNGGYTRIVKLGQRKNDAARVSLLALVDYDASGQVGKSSAKAKKKAAPKADEAPKAVAAPAVEEAKVEEAPEVVEEAVVEAVEAEAEEAVAETAQTEAPEAAEEAAAEESKEDDKKA